MLWNQPLQLRGSRKLHALELPQKPHGHRLSGRGMQEAVGAEKEAAGEAEHSANMGLLGPPQDGDQPRELLPVLPHLPTHA